MTRKNHLLSSSHPHPERWIPSSVTAFLSRKSLSTPKKPHKSSPLKRSLQPSLKAPTTCRRRSPITETYLFCSSPPGVNLWLVHQFHYFDLILTNPGVTRGHARWWHLSSISCKNDSQSGGLQLWFSNYYFFNLTIGWKRFPYKNNKRPGPKDMKREKFLNGWKGNGKHGRDEIKIALQKSMHGTLEKINYLIAVH